jgi:hypothetical protein
MEEWTKSIFKINVLNQTRTDCSQRLWLNSVDCFLLSYYISYLHSAEHLPKRQLIYTKLVGVKFKKSSMYIIRFEVLSTVVLNDTIFWDTAPRSPYVNRRFGEKYHFHLQGVKSAEDETTVRYVHPLNADTLLCWF